MFEERYRWHKFFDSEAELRERVPLNKVAGFNVAGHKVCIAHSPKGVKAVKDKCPHQGVALSNGSCTDNGKIVCPWHRYQFDLETGRGHGTYVEVYPMEERDDGLYIGFPYMAFTLFDRFKGK